MLLANAPGPLHIHASTSRKHIYVCELTCARVCVCACVQSNNVFGSIGGQPQPDLTTMLLGLIPGGVPNAGGTPGSAGLDSAAALAAATAALANIPGPGEPMDASAQGMLASPTGGAAAGEGGVEGATASQEDIAAATAAAAAAAAAAATDAAVAAAAAPMDGTAPEAAE